MLNQKTKNAEMSLIRPCSVKTHHSICQDFDVFLWCNKLFTREDRRPYYFKIVVAGLFSFIEFDVAHWYLYHYII